MWELDCEEAEHRRTDAFELWYWRRLLRVPRTARRSNQSILKEIIIFIGRTDVESETPVLWPPDAKSWLIGKDPDAGKDWGQEEKGMTEDEMAGWHHRLDGRESEWTLGFGDRQGGLACCDSWGRKESDTTEWLNWTELNIPLWGWTCLFLRHLSMDTGVGPTSWLLWTVLLWARVNTHLCVYFHLFWECTRNRIIAGFYV